MAANSPFRKKKTAEQENGGDEPPRRVFAWATFFFLIRGNKTQDTLFR
jgi:hypothetical protein